MTEPPRPQEFAIYLSEEENDVQRLVTTVMDQAAEIERLRAELAAADEQAREPAERAAAAIQLAETFREWNASPVGIQITRGGIGLELANALHLWEQVR